MKKVIMFLLAFAVVANVSFAAAIYVDASDSNSQTAGWTLRTGFANDSTIYQSYSGAEALVTTVSGLTPGQEYDVSVNYWNAEGQFWCVSAGFATDAMLFFADSASTGTNLATSTLTGVTEADRFELLGYIGSTVADANGNIVVYIDDEKADGHQTWNNRAWYDGLTVTEVPEPATMALMGLGGMLLRRRR